MKFIGLSLDPRTNEYLTVTECGDINLEQYKIFDEDKPESVEGFWYTIWEISWRLADALSELHNSEYMHKNMHPSNVVMFKNIPHFININLDVAPDESQHNYLPPESYQDQPYTAASDIYCLGTLMWQLVTGTSPQGKASEKPDELREEFPPVMPEKFQRIIRHCWKLDPRGRPSASQIYKLLGKCQEEMRTSRLSVETQTFIKNRREDYIKANLRDALNETITTQNNVKGSLDTTHKVNKAEVNTEDEESESVNLIRCDSEIWTTKDIDEILR